MALLRRTALMMPTGRATASASTMASRVRVSVVGIRSSTSLAAGSRWKNDVPKSPRRLLAAKRANCTASG